MREKVEKVIGSPAIGFLAFLRVFVPRGWFFFRRVNHAAKKRGGAVISTSEI